MPSDRILDEFVRFFQASSAALLPELLPLTLGIAGSLFTIQLAWQASLWVISGEEKILHKLLRHQVVFLGVYGVITLVPFWLPAYFEGFEFLGRRIAGVGLSPAAIFAQGLDLAFTMYDSWGKFFSALVPGIGTLRGTTMWIIIIAFGIVAIQMARVLVEVAVALGGGVVFLAFAAHRFTWSLAEGYARYLLDVGVRLYATFMVVAIGRNLGREWDDLLQGLELFSFRLHFTIVLAAAFFAVTAITLPATLSSRITSNFTFGGNLLADD